MLVRPAHSRVVFLFVPLVRRGMLVLAGLAFTSPASVWCSVCRSALDVSRVFSQALAWCTHPPTLTHTHTHTFCIPVHFLWALNPVCSKPIRLTQEEEEHLGHSPVCKHTLSRDNRRIMGLHSKMEVIKSYTTCSGSDANKSKSRLLSYNSGRSSRF